MSKATTSPAFRWLLRSVGTPATIATFLVVGVTGLLLFFKIRLGPISAIHEWVSLLFVLVAALHVIRNWTALSGYFKRRAFWVAVTGAGLISGLFLLAPSHPGPGREGQGAQRVLASASLGNLAPLLELTPAALEARLRARGLTVAGPQVTLKDVATASNRREGEVVNLAISPEP